MRQTIAGLLLCTGCLVGRPAPERDDRLLQEISRQETWGQQALDHKPTPADLDRIRGSDYQAVGKARRQLSRLIAAAERGTWAREACLEALRDEDDPRLLADFDRAGRIRAEAFSAADDLAEALAQASGGLTMPDLRPGLEALRKAQASEEKLARAQPRGLKLAPAPVPVPHPFLQALARLVKDDPELKRELDRLPPDDTTKVRARMSELDLEKPAPAAAPDKPAAPEVEAPQPADTLNISNELADLVKKKGAPKAITLRPDGFFSVHWDDQDVIVDPDGKLR